MDNKLILAKIDRLLHLCQKTEPKDKEKLPDNQLFTHDLIKVKDWYDEIKNNPRWKETHDVVTVMTQANSIWKFRHRIKELGWDNYDGIDEDVIKHILNGRKIEAIKLYRKHQTEVLRKECGLKEAKEYCDSLEKIILGK